ncbi:MAG: glycosyltransferase family 4 protein [Solirubrobacterales bacterium]
MGQLIYCYGRDFVRHASGAETFIRAHAMSATQLGLKPELFALCWKPGTRDLGYVKIVRSRSTGSEFRSEYVELYKHRLVPAIVRRLRDEPGPHVIHSFGTWAIAAQDATDKLRKLGVEVSHVGTCWELMGPHTRSKLQNQVVASDPIKRARQRFLLEWVKRSTIPAERRAMRAADTVEVNYRRLTALLHSEYGEEVHVSEMPYTTPAAFEPIADEYPLPAAISALPISEGPLVVTTSRQVPRKGLDVLIRAIARLRDEGVTVRAALVSRGTLLTAHRKLVEELRLGDRVTLPGLVPDIRDYLAHADIFCLPSIAEGSGSMSAIEALQFSVPVLSSAVDGMVEDLTDDVDALLVEPGSVHELTSALRRLAVDRALRDRLGPAGRERFESRFSVAAATNALAGLYAGFGLEVDSAASSAA